MMMVVMKINRMRVVMVMMKVVMMVVITEVMMMIMMTLMMMSYMLVRRMLVLIILMLEMASMDPDYGDTNVTSPDEMQKLQNRALRKILFKKQQDSLRHFYKKLRILKFSDLLCPQNLILDEKQKSSKI